MERIGDMEKVYEAVELLDDFCSTTACPECPIRRICNKIDKKNPIGQGILKSIKR